MIEACEGDWSRLVYDPKDGSITCWNAAPPVEKRPMRRTELAPTGDTAKALKKAARPKKVAKSAKPTPIAPKRAVKAAVKKAEQHPEHNAAGGGHPTARPRAKKTAAFQEPKPPKTESHIEPPEAAAHDLPPAVPAPSVPRQRPIPEPPQPQFPAEEFDPDDRLIDPWVPDEEIEGPWVPGAGMYDDGAEAESSAYKLSLMMKHGIPPGYRIRLQRKVMEMQLLREEDILPAIRVPQAVGVDRYTGECRYPVLRFRRGDLTVVVSFRQRILTVLGCYWANTPAPKGQGAGGGGSRKQRGVPKSRRQLITALRELGAEFDDEEDRPMVRFAGTELGQITLTEPRPRLDWEGDWQRMQRKISAIRRGEQSN